MKKSSNKRLNIALAFDDSLDRVDGVQQQLKTLGRWLAKSECNVSYLVGQTSTKVVSGQPVFSLSKNFVVSANQNKLSLPLPTSQSAIDEVFDKGNFDVVHITLPFSPFLGRQIVRAALKRSIPLMGTFHTFPASKLQWLGSYMYGLWLRRYLKLFSAVTSVSNATQQYVRKAFSTQSIVLPNFIDVKHFADGKIRSELRQKKFTVLYLNRLVKRKGPLHLLEAIGILNSQGRFSDAQLILAGSGGLSKIISKRAVELKLSHKIILTGFIDEADKADYLASADLAVYPATGGEAFGIVLLEAMAAGTLVLGGENPGYKSVLQQQPELLVDATKHEQLASRIEQLLADKTLRKRLLTWQSKHIRQYDIDVVGRDILDIYSNISQ